MSIPSTARNHQQNCQNWDDITSSNSLLFSSSFSLIFKLKKKNKTFLFLMVAIDIDADIELQKLLALYSSSDWK